MASTFIANILTIIYLVDFVMNFALMLNNSKFISNSMVLLLVLKTHIAAFVPIVTNGIAILQVPALSVEGMILNKSGFLDRISVPFYINVKHPTAWIINLLARPMLARPLPRTIHHMECRTWTLSRQHLVLTKGTTTAVPTSAMASKEATIMELTEAQVIKGAITNPRTTRIQTGTNIRATISGMLLRKVL
jgi:hypothetical protein